MPKITDSVHTCYEGGSWNLQTECYGRTLGTTGHVETIHGFVRCYSYTDNANKKRNRSDLSIIKEGKMHHRTFHGIAYSERGLVTKAKQFAREVFEDA
jgi:hypothetical protein